MSELRFDPLLGEWLVTATRRQDRTFLPPADFCPLCPTLGPEAFPTEVPEADYDLVAFENLFPSLRIDPEVPAIEDDDLTASVGPRASLTSHGLTCLRCTSLIEKVPVSISDAAAASRCAR